MEHAGGRAGRGATCAPRSSRASVPMRPPGRGGHSMSRQLFVDVPIPIRPASPEPSFDVRLHETAPGEMTVQMIGELDIASAELLTAVVRSHSCPKVVRLDLSGLSFADCAGLRAIEAIWERVHANGGRLVLVHAGERLRWLLRMTGSDVASMLACTSRSEEEAADA